VGVVVADMFQAIAILGVVESLIRDLSAAFGEAKQGTAVELASKKIGQPESLADGAVGFVVAVTKHPDDLPA